MSLIPNLSNLFAGGRSGSQDTVALHREESTLNLQTARFTPRTAGAGALLLGEIEKTATLFKLLQECTDVSLDRFEGTLSLTRAGRGIKTEALHVASEVFSKQTATAQLYFMPRSPLREYLASEHVQKVEALLACAAEQGRAPKKSGLVATSEPTRPYSTLGKAPFKPLPETVRHADHEFFAPGPERAAFVQFLSGLCGQEHVVLPAIVLHGSAPRAVNNLSVTPLWHLVGLGEEVRSVLSAQDPLERFHSLMFHWAPFLGTAGYDLPETVSDLAKGLGLSETRQDPSFPEAPTQFIISNGDPRRNLVAQVGRPDDSGRQYCLIQWAKHM
jgi:hypothetical protein